MLNSFWIAPHFLLLFFVELQYGLAEDYPNISVSGLKAQEPSYLEAIDAVQMKTKELNNQKLPASYRNWCYPTTSENCPTLDAFQLLFFIFQVNFNQHIYSSAAKALRSLTSICDLPSGLIPILQLQSRLMLLQGPFISWSEVHLEDIVGTMLCEF